MCRFKPYLRADTENVAMMVIRQDVMPGSARFVRVAWMLSASQVSTARGHGVSAGVRTV